MATSDRILTVLPQAAAAGRISPGPTAFSNRPSWHQAALDFTVIACALSVTGYWGSAFMRVQHVIVFLPLTVAGMITVVLAFCGAYKRDRSPLDITEAEGLARGICCTLLLLSMLALATRSGPSAPEIGACLLVIALLVLQREIARILSAKTARVRASASSSSKALRFSLLPEEDIQQTDTGDRGASDDALLKRSIDIVISGFLLVLLIPVFVLTAVMIKLDSRGPVFVRQLRVGKYGRSFYMWKFRSMQADVERYARSPVTDLDPRLTRLGRILRRVSLDELPQLLNVLKGDMSLVGPRPEMPFIVERYNAYQRLRLNATPGLTGLWQISPARAMPIHENIEFDLFYIQHQNIFLDVAILLRTASAVVRGVGAI